MKYKFPVKLTFDGFVEVNAENEALAREYVEKHFGCAGINLQTTIEDLDWDFPVHPEKKIGEKLD